MKKTVIDILIEGLIGNTIKIYKTNNTIFTQIDSSWSKENLDSVEEYEFTIEGLLELEEGNQCDLIILKGTSTNSTVKSIAISLDSKVHII